MHLARRVAAANCSDLSPKSESLAGSGSSSSLRLFFSLKAKVGSLFSPANWQRIDRARYAIAECRMRSPAAPIYYDVAPAKYRSRPPTGEARREARGELIARETNDCFLAFRAGVFLSLELR